MSIGLMICFARSGGTMLNRALKTNEKVVMLSEVNPVGGGWGKEKEKSNDSPYLQAKNWYNIELKSRDYLDSILELSQICKNDGNTLIVRDWSYVNFSKHEYNSFSPSQKLENYTLLTKHVELEAFAFVRNAVDVWISRGCPEINEFSSAYLSYAKEVIANKIPIFKYEDFVNNPASEIAKIGKLLNLKGRFELEKFSRVLEVNGDTQIIAAAGDRDIIKKRKRKPIDKFMRKELYKNNEIEQANEMLGYSSRYYRYFVKHLIDRYL